MVFDAYRGTNNDVCNTIFYFRKLQAPCSALVSGATCGMHVFAGLSNFFADISGLQYTMVPCLAGYKILLIYSSSIWHRAFDPPRRDPATITSTQVVADRDALRIWRGVSLPEGGQKFWLQWQLADTAWLACACVAASQSAAQRPSNAPTQSHSLQRSHPHLNSIFASKLHARDPFHWVICFHLIRWHGSTSSGSCHNDGNYFTWPWKIAIIFVV